MGPVRHRQLIRLLALLVALDLVAGVGALYTRAGTASAATRAARTSHGVARSSVPADSGGGAEGNGILAGGHFSHRRGSGGGTSAGQGTSQSAAPSSTRGSPSSTTSSPASTGTSRPSGGSPTSTAGSPSSTGHPTPSSTGRPGTSSTGAATTSSTTGPSARTGSVPTGGGATPGTTPTTVRSAPTGSGGQSVAFDDRTGDTVADGSHKPIAEGPADIVHSTATYGPGAVVLTVQVRQPVDPRQDPHWASDSTYLTWEVDTTGDAAPDFEIQYFLDAGALVAGVSRVNDTDGASACAAEPGYGPDGYTVAFQPGCLGSPASFSYRASVFYDSDPKKADADLITDVAPDGGLSRPVARPAG